MISIEKIAELQEFSKDLKVLYVEDNKEARVSTLDVLEQFFENITVAVDGQEGLEKFNENSFDLIISDINMPRMNGIDMVSNIRKTDTEIPILIISAYSESGYFMETIRLGVEGYLLKPIELEQFITMISKVLEKIKLKMIQKKYQEYLEKENIYLNKNIIKKDKFIQDQIYVDSVTKLKNRFALEKDVIDSCGEFLAMILIDINNFRKINELYGFHNGNKILIQVSNDLKEFTLDNSLNVYRVSADEFIVLGQFSSYDLQLLDSFLKSVLNLLDNKRIKIENDNEILLNITVGLALDSKNVLTKATSALDIAKLNGKKYVFYDESNNFQGELKNLFFWQNNIDTALENNNIVPYFQPIFDEDKNIVKYEVLMRMIQVTDGEMKVITPFNFLDISIKTRQYEELSFRVVSQALDFARKNKDKVFSINLSYTDMTNLKIKNIIHSYVNESIENNMDCNIIFEFVESENIKDYKEVSAFFENFKCSKIQIAIDDFGSGYSNFTNLLEINPKYIKIDGSLIKDININEKHLILTRAIISFAKQLNINTIAEYVHNEEIFEMLKAEGVDEFQGFYLQEPRENI
jgi:diguanylate cyclase (GGDEF)-like protein